MHDGQVGPVSDQHKELLGDILTSAKHLLQLINDILDLSKVEAGKQEFHPEPVDLKRLVAEVSNIVGAVALKRKIRIETRIADDLGELVLDPGKLKQVLYNYLSNAVKFTPEGGVVRIRARNEDAVQFRLEVEDSGIGIAPENIEQLFQEFQQLDQGASKRYQGTGLGLALTKKIVEAQGGRVGVQTELDHGSTFYAILPRKAGTNEPPPVRDVAQRECSAGVMVIEGNASERDHLVEAVRDAGFTAEGVSSGRAAIALCMERRFSAITLEVQLPDISGWEVLAAIRSHGLNRKTPVVLVTIITELGLAGGFSIHDIIWKPVDPARVVESLTNAGVRAGANCRILVVDDDPKALKLMETTLRTNGYSSTGYPSGAEGLKHLQSDAPDAIILDLVMPEMDGFQFLDRFRATEHCATVPVIIWTSKDLSHEENVRLHRMAQGVVLKKHGDVKQILDQLRKHLVEQPEG
jgi:CheY-like chemotaxis protein